VFAHRTNWNLTTNRLSEALSKHRAAGTTLLDLTASNPTECGFQYAPHAVMRALCSPRALEYHPDPKGLLIAREAVRKYYRDIGLNVSLEDMALTASTSEAYSFVFRLLCNPDDELLAPAPSYPLFDFLAGIQDVKLKPYPLIYDHGWQIDLHALEQAVSPQTRGVIVVNPNNPTGHFVKQDEMRALNQICSERNMAIIADEVFLDFSLGSNKRNQYHHGDTETRRLHGEERWDVKGKSKTGGKPETTEAAKASGTANILTKSFAGNHEALTFTMSGISKISGLPQMKLAWLIVNGPEQEKEEALGRLEVIADTYLSLSTPIQLAAPVLLELRHGFQEQLMARVHTNLAELDRQLAQQKTCSRLKVEGGWYAILRVPATRSDEELALELLEKQGVYIHPGHFYDFQQEGILVVSLITPEQEFSEGTERVLRSLELP
jgi:aspartate/methionine/tyrosine aminotransferase